MSTATSSPFANATPPKVKNAKSAIEMYTIIKANSEGGDKRMLDVIFECLKYTIKAEWSEGHAVAKMLDTYEEDVTIPPLA
jgi:hypothetical protein